MPTALTRATVTAGLMAALTLGALTYPAHADDDHQHKPAAVPTAQQSALDAVAADVLVAQMQAEAAKTELNDAQAAVARNKAALKTAREASAKARTAEAEATIELTTAGYKTQSSLYALETLVRSSYLNSSANSMPRWTWVVLGKSDDLRDQVTVEKAEANATNSTTNDYLDRSEDSTLSERLAAKAAEARQQRQDAEAEIAERLEKAEELDTLVETVTKRADQLKKVQTQRLAEAEKLVDADRTKVATLAKEAQKLQTQLEADIDRLPKRMRKVLDASVGGMSYPATGSITSPFGQRFHPILRYTKLHTGTDFSVGDGNAYAAASGIVLSSSPNRAYGNLVTIGHGKIGGQVVETWYAHLAQSNVKVGQRIHRGQVIGRIGSTGYSTGPHLHFEVRLNGEPQQPMKYLAGAVRPGAKR